MLQKLFLEHPRHVGETYGGHMRTASLFGVRMIAGGIGCLIHGVFPSLFVKTGSNMVRELYGEIQPRSERAAQAATPAPQFLPEDEI